MENDKQKQVIGKKQHCHQLTQSKEGAYVNSNAKDMKVLKQLIIHIHLKQPLSAALHVVKAFPYINHRTIRLSVSCMR